MSLCTRNCWIFGALMGALVVAFALLGGVGLLAGLFLGFVTAWLLGGLLVLLFCEGNGGEVEEVSFDEDKVVARPDPLPLHPRPDAPPIAEAPRPAGMPGAPEGAGPAGVAVTFAEGAAAPVSGFAGAQAAATQIEDRRAVMGDPSDSADHTAPGEAAKKPKKPKDDKKPAKAKGDKPVKAKKSKDKVAKRADDAPSTDASRIKRARAEEGADGGDDAPPPAMTVTTRDRPADPDADDLGRIDGIGPRLTDWLHQNGVTRFAQIAAWTPEDAADWAQRLGRWGGRIESDDWIGQARILAAGGETDHSRRVDAGVST